MRVATLHQLADEQLADGDTDPNRSDAKLFSVAAYLHDGEDAMLEPDELAYARGVVARASAKEVR